MYSKIHGQLSTYSVSLKPMLRSSSNGVSMFSKLHNTNHTLYRRVKNLKADDKVKGLK